MLLSAEIIEFELARFCQTTSQVSLGSHLCLQPPLLYQVGQPWHQSGIYVVSTEQLPLNTTTERAGLLIICGNAKQTDLPEGQDGLLIGGETTPAQVLNHLQAVFAKYDSWDQQLQAMLNRDEPISKLLEISLPIMENSLSVSESDLSVLCYALYEPTEDSPTLQLITEHRNSPDNIRKLLDDISSFRNLTEPYLYPADNFGFPVMGCNLYDGPSFIGNLNLLGSRPFRPHDAALVAHLGQYAELLLRREKSLEKRRITRLQDVFRALLERRYVDEELLHTIWQSAGFEPTHNYRCLAIHLPSELPYGISQYLQAELSSVSPATVAFEHQGMMAVFINHSRATATNPQLSDTERIIAELGLHAGASDCYDNVFDSRHYFAEAEAALNMGIDAQDAQTIYHFGDYSDRFILRHCTGELKAEMLFPPGLHRLLSHDGQSATSYVDTLRAYLDENMNTVRAARRLCIQRNSLLGRLGRLERLLDADLNDAETRFRLALCLRLLDYKTRLK